MCFDDVSGEVYDWIFSHLESKKFPFALAVGLAHLVSRSVTESIRQKQDQQSKEQGDKSSIENPLSFIGNSGDVKKEAFKHLSVLSAQLLKSLTSEYLQNTYPLDESPLTTFPVSSIDEVINPFLPTMITSTYSIRNGRKTMEDRHVVIHNLNKVCGIESSTPFSYYAVFDGHAGVEAATFAASHLHYKLVSCQAFNDGDYEDALRFAFKRTDDDYLERSALTGIKAGCTAIVCLKVSTHRLYFAWAGDSQAILVRDGRPIDLTPPHKPEDESERKRIEDLGGEVHKIDTWRVQGTLAVSRAIGDPDFRPYVTAEPGVAMITLDSSDEFIILACDGLWDQLTPDDATQMVYEHLCQPDVSENPIKLLSSAQSVAQVLVENAQKEGSTDNITAIVIFLKDITSMMTSFSSNTSASYVTANESFLDQSTLGKDDFEEEMDSQFSFLDQQPESLVIPSITSTPIASQMSFMSPDGESVYLTPFHQNNDEKTMIESSDHANTTDASSDFDFAQSLSPSFISSRQHQLLDASEEETQLYSIAPLQQQQHSRLLHEEEMLIQEEVDQNRRQPSSWTLTKEEEEKSDHSQGNSTSTTLLSQETCGRYNDGQQHPSSSSQHTYLSTPPPPPPPSSSPPNDSSLEGELSTSLHRDEEKVARQVAKSSATKAKSESFSTVAPSSASTRSTATTRRREIVESEQEASRLLNHFDSQRDVIFSSSADSGSNYNSTLNFSHQVGVNKLQVDNTRDKEQDSHQDMLSEDELMIIKSTPPPPPENENAFVTASSIRLNGNTNNYFEEHDMKNDTNPFNVDTNGGGTPDLLRAYNGNSKKSDVDDGLLDDHHHHINVKGASDFTSSSPSFDSPARSTSPQKDSFMTFNRQNVYEVEMSSPIDDGLFDKTKTYSSCFVNDEKSFARERHHEQQQENLFIGNDDDEEEDATIVEGNAIESSKVYVTHSTQDDAFLHTESASSALPSSLSSRRAADVFKDTLTFDECLLPVSTTTMSTTEESVIHQEEPKLIPRSTKEESYHTHRENVESSHDVFDIESSNPLSSEKPSSSSLMEENNEVDKLEQQDVEFHHETKNASSFFADHAKTEYSGRDDDVNQEENLPKRRENEEVEVEGKTTSDSDESDVDSVQENVRVKREGMPFETSNTHCSESDRSFEMTDQHSKNKEFVQMEDQQFEFEEQVTIEEHTTIEEHQETLNTKTDKAFENFDISFSQSGTENVWPSSNNEIRIVEEECVEELIEEKIYDNDVNETMLTTTNSVQQNFDFNEENMKSPETSTTNEQLNGEVIFNCVSTTTEVVETMKESQAESIRSPTSTKDELSSPIRSEMESGISDEVMPTPVKTYTSPEIHKVVNDEKSTVGKDRESPPKPVDLKQEMTDALMKNPELVAAAVSATSVATVKAASSSASSSATSKKPLSTKDTTKTTAANTTTKPAVRTRPTITTKTTTSTPSTKPTTSTTRSVASMTSSTGTAATRALSTRTAALSKSPPRPTTNGTTRPRVPSTTRTSTASTASKTATSVVSTKPKVSAATTKPKTTTISAAVPKTTRPTTLSTRTSASSTLLKAPVAPRAATTTTGITKPLVTRTTVPRTITSTSILNGVKPRVSSNTSTSTLATSKPMVTSTRPKLTTTTTTAKTATASSTSSATTLKATTRPIIQSRSTTTSSTSNTTTSKASATSKSLNTSAKLTAKSSVSKLSTSNTTVQNGTKPRIPSSSKVEPEKKA